jgi:hypothetical protein
MQVDSIADHLDLVDLIAQWHFAEWGHLDPSGTLEAWTEGLRQRTRCDQIPTTYVAVEPDELLGSVTLVEHDMLTRPRPVTMGSRRLCGTYTSASRHRKHPGSLRGPSSRSNGVQTNVTVLSLSQAKTVTFI